MPKVIILSGPIGAGKSTVARELVALMPGSVACIEGDKFWPFIVKSETQDRPENGYMIMRSMTAAAIPFVRCGFDVVLDFTIPPEFLATARKILKDLPLEYVILRPSEAVCAGRAAARKAGAIADYSKYSDFYALFVGTGQYQVNDDKADPAALAAKIFAGLKSGRFWVP
jgi:predicted kinase